jgi:hypothetical protein
MRSSGAAAQQHEAGALEVSGQVLRCQIGHQFAAGAPGRAPLVVAQGIGEGFGELLGETPREGGSGAGG